MGFGGLMYNCHTMTEVFRSTGKDCIHNRPGNFEEGYCLISSRPLARPPNAPNVPFLYCYGWGEATFCEPELGKPVEQPKTKTRRAKPKPAAGS